MLTIKLARTGKKNAPAFRIMANSEVVGSFNPQNTPPKLELNKERIDWWTKHGAQLSPAVSKLLKGKYEFKSYTGSVAKEPKQAVNQPTGTQQGSAQAPQTTEQSGGNAPTEAGTTVSQEPQEEKKQETAGNEAKSEAPEQAEEKTDEGTTGVPS